MTCKCIYRTAMLTGLAVFVWGMISWMVLPWHNMTVKSFTNEQTVQLSLLQNIDSKEPAIYSLPAMSSEKNKEQTGPYAFIALSPMGLKFSPMMMLKGLATQILLALLIVGLLMKTSGLNYWGKVKFVTVIGLVTAIVASVPNMNWWGFGLEYSLVMIVDQVIAWFIGGLVLAKLTD
ncbi:MAG: hypothetical protein HOA17_01400 [Candidatus Melainabacteria bacterium]|nr:hypothetical protein [Candidatus Melainabacteria bacterium]